MRSTVRRRLRLATAIGLAGVLVAAVLLVVSHLRGTRRATCTASVPNERYELTPSRAANATTIAAAGVRLGMPDHAVTVALAAALQESRLDNLPGGDRDSVGLFQQRPSQGWGRAAQLSDPSYAATAFYRALARVPGWAEMPVTDAAQRVQRSATPAAYARWETEARVLARVLTGEVAAGFACRFVTVPTTTRADEAANAAVAALGSPGTNVPVSTGRGWTIASWLVGHAPTYGIVDVTFAGWEWSATRGTWERAGATSPRVEFRVNA